MAAGVATIFGDKEGIPILIRGLYDNSILLLTEPPQLICDYSSMVLRHYTKRDFGYECGAGGVDMEAVRKWEDWWENSKDKIVWNDEEKKYGIE